jgi:hypothetical protein
MCEKVNFFGDQKLFLQRVQMESKKAIFYIDKVAKVKKHLKNYRCADVYKKNFAILTAILRFFVSAFLRSHLQFLNQHKNQHFSIPAMFSAYRGTYAQKTNISNPLKKLYSFEIQYISFNDRFSK